jgi:hypothetical protein
MMIVNPTTLTADITTSVEDPDATFPTISNVPGGMISFTYHLEVVIDLFGKLRETRFLPRLTSSDPLFTPTQDSGNQLTSEWSNNILDTSQLRRTKSVVTFEMSVTIGSKDSSRRKKQVPVQPEGQNGGNVPHSHAQEWTEDAWGEEGYDYYYDDHSQPQYYDPNYYDPYYYGGYDGYQNGNWDHRQPYPNQHPPPANIVPPPEPEEEVDEKTRLRRQEEMLMPSQPP